MSGASGQGGVFGNPGLLAAGAAGCVSAVCALWAMRGLPLGTGVLWIASFPLFAAGLGFGVASAAVASLLGVLLVAISGGGFAAVIYLALFGIPAPLLVLAAQGQVPGQVSGQGLGQGPAPGQAPGAGPGRVSLSLPLALLGLWPLAVLLLSAAFLAGSGGLEAAMRQAMEVALRRLGMPAPETLVAGLVRVKAGAIGFWAAIALLANAGAAAGFLAKRGLLRGGKPDWAAVRLPGWYPVLPALALGLFLAAPAGGDAVALSALLLLLVPLFLQGVAGVHARLRGRKARLPMLVGFYLLVVLFLQLMGPGLVGLGLYDQFLRRQAPRQT
ncbi:hypothetical protein [Paracraurococcus ruber]|uniref:DUF2232 domain-containing protein n=1 Tax=Paracraurococcus ruber TaxID=77675 RepID=A0ABS1D481_9PROT|nr:hypothetical protein [Paracraurococcus ruber]MBK1661680.1 hypothetical protein [Paracraurococcus ruber]TDG18075.1 hypothetical protein E2C05_28225 [Paracraurococcus ruber]